MLYLPAIVIGFFGILLEAAILLSLYGYFLLPLGTPILSYWHLYGIALFINLITWQAPEYDFSLSEYERSKLSFIKVSVELLKYILVWFVGFLIYSLAGPF